MGRCFRRRKRNGKIPKFNKGSATNKLSIFLQWLSLNLETTPVVLRDFRVTGRGLMASKNIPEGSVIISVPYRFIITTSSIDECPLKKYILRSCLKLSPLEAMSLFLMYEKFLGSASKWFPYLNMLPTSYSLLHLWEDREMKLLPQSLSSVVFKQKQDIKYSYEKVEKVVTLMCDQNVISHYEIDKFFNFSIFQWALSTLSSRSVYMRQSIQYEWLNGASDVCALVPYLDMFNHSTYARVEAGYNNANQCYEIKTFDSFKKYEQVFIKYGSLDNTELLTNYGFICCNNPNDSLSFELEDVIEAMEYVRVDQQCTPQLFPREVATLNRHLCISNDGISYNLMKLIHLLSSPEENSSNAQHEMDVMQLKGGIEIMRRLLTPLLHHYTDCISQVCQMSHNIRTHNENLAVEYCGIFIQMVENIFKLLNE